MVRAWESTFDVAAHEISCVRRDLGSFDTRALSIVGAEKDSLLRARASTHVWLAAIMERFTTDWVHSICSEFNSLGIRWCDARNSLFSVACGAEFQSFDDGVKKDIWSKKVSIFDLLACTDVASLSTEYVPINGKTIRPSHLDDIWLVFGLKKEPFPSAIHRAVLTTIANQRNDIAHGKVRPVSAGAAYTYGDYISHLQKVEDIIEHMVLMSEDYFVNKLFLR